jgi:hypothetical protein
MPGLAEMRDATLAALCHGDEAPFRIIETRLVIGDRVGQIDDGVPQMPLAADLVRWQRRTRVVPEALESDIALDLRSEPGLLKSVLLHRLNLIAVPWGRLVDAQAGRGTFREIWKLTWAPEFSVRLAEALVYGPTIELAAAGAAAAQAAKSTIIAELTNLVRRCLLANLPDAAQACIARLQAAAVNAADMTGLAEAVPPLVSVLRYGTARKIPEEAIGALTRTLAVEMIAGAAQASRNLDDEAAARWRSAVTNFDATLELFDDQALLETWSRTLTVLASDSAAAPVIAGLAARRLYERSALTTEATAATLSRALSPAKVAAEFLDGFFAQSAEVILHDHALFAIVDNWAGLARGGGLHQRAGDGTSRIFELRRNGTPSSARTGRSRCGTRARRRLDDQRGGVCGRAAAAQTHSGDRR